MHHAVSLRVVRTGALVELELADRGTRPTRAALDGQRFAVLHDEVTRRLAPPAVLIPGLDVRRSDDEVEAGRALGALFAEVPTLAAALGRWLGEARGRQARPVLLVDTDDHDRALPWELLALEGGPLAVTDGAVVVRRLEGPPARPLPAGPVTVHCWCPDADDPAAARLRSGLDDAVEAIGWPAPKGIDDAPEGPVVLHLIGHGRQLLDGFGVDLGGDAASATTTAHVLRPLLERALVVVLDVCEAADTSREALDTLAGQLVRAGARAVVAPTQRIAVDAAAQATPALYAALASGQGVVDALAAAQRAVRGLASPHPDGRWHNLGLYVADVAGLEAQAPASGGWRPQGWPVPGPDLSELLERARREAERRDAGFVGLEHLLEAQRALDGGGPAARAASDVAGGEALRRAQKLRRVADAPFDLTGTPRLVALGPRLEPGADVEDLFATLWSDLDGGLAALAGIAPSGFAVDTATAETLDPAGMDGDTPVASTLEVLGGPEDGRRLPLGVGDALGRIGGDARVRLYEGCSVVDPYLSRSALVWEGEGCVTLSRHARHSTGVGWEKVSGRVVLRAGERLEIGPATCLRGLP